MNVPTQRPSVKGGRRVTDFSKRCKASPARNRRTDRSARSSEKLLPTAASTPAAEGTSPARNGAPVLQLKCQAVLPVHRVSTELHEKRERICYAPALNAFPTLESENR